LIYRRGHVSGEVEWVVGDSFYGEGGNENGKEKKEKKR